MYQIICQMCPPEAKSFLPGRRLPESKISRKIKVGNKTQHISQGIGYIDLNEFLGQARIAGYFDPNEIETAILENNGQISFLPKSSSRPATPEDLALTPEPTSAWYDLILDGRLMEDNLKAAGRDETWLNSQLHQAGIGQRAETFYAACDKQGRFFACRGK